MSACFVPLSRRFSLVCFAIISIAIARGQSPAPSIQARITGAVDERSLVSLRGNTPPVAQAQYDRGPAPVSMPANRLILVLKRSTLQEAGLQTYLASVQDPNSPSYHKFLTPEKFGAQFGVGDADIQTIQTWLTAHGMKIGKVSKGRMAIEISGTVGQVQDAFHTSIHSFVIGGKQYWGNASDPQIPAALGPVVEGLASLSSFKPIAQYIRAPSGVYDPSTHRIKPTYTFGSAQSGYYIFLGPADAATIYDTTTTLNPKYTGTIYDGTGVTIGVAGDSNIDVTQNANYRATFGLPAKATTVTVDGTDPGENGDAIEAYLDTQIAGGIAPNANVILYTAADTYYQSGLFLAIARALDDNQVDILNVSFGACEAEFGGAGNQYVNDLWEQAAAQGIAVTVSTGDSGSAGCDNPNTEQAAIYSMAVNGIASTPYNIAVGGTDFDVLYTSGTFPASFTNYVDITNTLPDHRSALKYIPEEPWNDSTSTNASISKNKPLSAIGGSNNIIAGGGGVSNAYPLPTWQTGNGAVTGRNLPDVSFLAGNGFYGAAWGICTDQDYDPPTGTSMADCAGTSTTGNAFNLTGIGGTSAAAPAFAGMLALVQQKTGSRLGQADYVLYDLAKQKYGTVFHDVTTGDNSVDCLADTPNCLQNSLGYFFLSGYNAAANYDNASGLGSVDAMQMVNNWSSAGLITTSSSLKLNGGTTALSITHGQSVTVNASVTGTSGTPTGNVALVDSLSPSTLPGNESIADFSLASGSASGTTNSLPGGSYNISAHYGGSSSYGESDSNAIPVTVSAETSTTDIKVAGYFDPSTGQQVGTPYYGYIYLIDAQPYGNSATASSPDGNATGTITFKNGASTLGTANLNSNGIAELQTTMLPGGTNSLTAVFPGDASFQASTSVPLAFTVMPAPTTIGYPSIQPNNYVTAGASLTFGINLSTDSAGAAPTGTVKFMSGSTVLGTATIAGVASTRSGLAAGTATFTTNSLLPGSYSVTGVYSGDSNYAGTTSNAGSLTIVKDSTPITVTPSAIQIIENHALQVTVTLAPVSGLPAPTGSVTLTYNGSPGITTAPGNLVNGTATITIPANSLALGLQTIMANYSGDSVFAVTSGSTSVEVLSSGTIQPTVTVIPPSSITNYPVSINVNVTGPSGSPVPTGSVTLSDAAGQSSQPLVSGSTVFTIQSGLAPGSNGVMVTYLGDSNYTSGSGSANLTIFAAPIFFFSPQSPTIAANQPLTTTVTVSSGNASIPPGTGTVTVSAGSYNSGPVQLATGTASFTIPANSLPVGTDTITASYSGDVNYDPGTGTESVSVNAAQPPSFAASGTSVSLAPGATANNTSTITLTPAGGFTGSVTLTASITSGPTGAVNLPTLSFGATSPVSITDTNAKTATMTVSTTAATSGALRRTSGPGAGLLGAGGVLACVLLFGFSERRIRWQTMLGLLVFLIFLGGGVMSCGGGGGGGGGNGNPGTTPGAYTVTVTGTSGATIAQCTVNIQVQ